MAHYPTKKTSSRALARACAALTLGAVAFSSACSGDNLKNVPEDPGGNDNYGDDYIGYKNQAVEAAAEDYASASGTGGSAAMTGAEDSSLPWDPDAGAAGAGFGGAVGSLRAALSWNDPSRGAAPTENPFVEANADAVSTFSIDVDTGSFTLARAAINDGVLPDRDSVRIEEFLNYFHFHYGEPEGEMPLALYSEIASCPWAPKRELLMLGVQGQELAVEEQPPLNLVLLLDISGSMSSSDKLPLLKRGFRMLARQLRPEDRVSIVTYAGQDTILLEGAHGDQKELIDSALAQLESGGSTNGEGGIQKAYDLAAEYFIEGGSNRVLLGTDGDFNVGLSETSDLVDFIAEKRDTGVFLSVYGFGDAWGGGNYQDDVGEQLADNGNGIYFYIDSEEEMQRAFMHTVSGSLFTVAKDVKLQVEFNPEHVKGYRLIGYENRVLSDASFSDDSVDAGELGSGLSVTALYEIIPADSSESVPAPKEDTIPESVIAAEADTSEGEAFPDLKSKDYVNIRLRYKESDSDESQLITQTRGIDQRRDEPSHKMLFAAGVVEFASLLRGSQYLVRERSDDLVEQIHQTLRLDREGAIKEAETLLKDAIRLAN